MPKLEHPYHDLTGGQWLRGNLHTHTTRSDGKREPQVVLDDYAQRGYDFLMISDHDIFTSAKDYERWNARGMTLIPGNEVSLNGPHILHVDGDRFIEPTAQRQLVLGAIQASRGFAVVNHPNWEEAFDHCPIASMREWVGYIGLEIYNGVIGRLPGSPYATNKWDMLLHEGWRPWGFANDDSHREEDVELGWNMVYAPTKTPAAIVEGMLLGRFYPSTGVVISSIRVTGMRIRVETTNAQRIVAIHRCGKRFAFADSPSIEVDVPADSGYVRFECWGAGESFAWTQPFFVVD